MTHTDVIQNLRDIEKEVHPMPEPMKQYLYQLKLIPRLLDEGNWTQTEEDIVSEHFLALQALEAKGRLILAGRTLNMDPDGMGLVIFRAKSEEEANRIMESDPAVAKGVMTARLFPYKVALISEANASGEA